MNPEGNARPNQGPVVAKGGRGQGFLRGLPGWLGRYGLAVLAVAAGTLSSWLLRDWCGGLPFLTFYLPVALVALLGGGGPGVLTTVLSAAVVALWLRFGMHGASATVALGLFTATGLIVSTTAELLHRARRREAAQALHEREEQLRLFAEHAPVAIALLDANLRYLAVTERWLMDFGLVGQDLRGRSHYEVFPEVPPRWKEIHRRCLAGAVERAEEDAFERADGRTQWLRWEIRPWYAASGAAVGGIVIFSEDVTERKWAEEMLRASGERLRQVVRVARLGIFEHDHRTDGLYWSPELRAIYDWDEEDSVTFTATLARIHPEDREAVAAVIRRAHDPAGDGTYDVEHRIVRRDGTVRWVKKQAQTFFEGDGAARHPVRTIGAVADVTGRRQAEEALRDQEARLRAILDTAVDAIITIDERGLIELVNTAAERLFGYPAGEMIGQNVKMLMPSPYRQEHDGYLGNFLETGVKRIIGIGREVLGRRKDGTIFPMDLAVGECQLGDQKWFTGCLHDLTRRKRAEEQLRRQAELIDKASDAIVVRDLEDRVVFWNKGAERLYGWTAAEAVGRTSRELMYQGQASEELKEAHGIVLIKGEWSGELRGVTRGGRSLVVESRWTLLRDGQGQPVAKLVINTDITDKKKLEAQLLRAQRLESIGTLAGGIAHDLNNVLTPILMAVKILKRNRPDTDRQSLLDTAQASVERCAEMVKQLLAFAGGMEGQRTTLQPKHVIRELEGILEHTFSRSIAFRVILAGDLWSISGDSTQLSQVLMNLCVNARDAMPDGGTLTITAENQVLNEEDARMRQGARPGPYVLLTVSDTGSGIPPEVLDRVFDPFFTTKGAGKGTGLGLSTALGIVKGHGGFIHLSSEGGQGTKVAVFLPAQPKEAAPSVQEHRPALASGRGQTVLVVDDEAFILATTRAALQASDYRVFCARDGAEALVLFQENREAIRVVLLDMMMPDMDGLATLQELHRLDPHLPVVVTSGMGGSEALRTVMLAGAKAFLPKPYSDEQLVEMLGKVLQGT